MRSLACCACIRHFVYLLCFPKIQSHLSSCLLHFHSVYKMDEAFIPAMSKSKSDKYFISAEAVHKAKPVIEKYYIFKDNLVKKKGKKKKEITHTHTQIKASMAEKFIKGMKASS